MCIPPCAFQTRVLVTNGLHWLPRVDQVVVLVKGVVSEVGTYGELLQHDGPFAKYLKTYLLHEDQEGEDTDPEGIYMWFLYQWPFICEVKYQLQDCSKYELYLYSPVYIDTSPVLWTCYFRNVQSHSVIVAVAKIML